MRKLLIGLVSVLLVACSPTVDKDALQEDLNIEFNEELLTLDSGSIFDPQAAIAESNGEVSFPEIAIDTSAVGEIEFVYIITHEKYSDVSKEVVVTYEILEPLKLEMKGEEFYTHLGDDINTDIFIEEYSGLLTKPEYIDVYTDGSETKYMYSVSNRSGTEVIEKEILIKVTDMSPVIHGATSEFKITVGSSYDFGKITATDFYGNPLEVEVVGNWNSKKVGRYPLQYRVVDSELRETIYNFTFVTVAKPSVGGNSNTSSSGNGGSTSSAGENTNTGSSTNPENGGGSSEITYACPNAVYDKNLPCDTIMSVSKGEKQFHGSTARDDCWNYGTNLIDTGQVPEGAYSFACRELMKNDGSTDVVGFGWNYK